METSKVSLKLLVDKKGNKVIFAEAGKDFVDFLLYLLTLPLGTVIRLLTKHGMVGSIGNLYKTVQELDETYMQTKEAKTSVLEPSASICVSEIPRRLLPANVCPDKTSSSYGSFYTTTRTEPAKEKGFVKSMVIYTVKDNLEVSPMSTISTIGLLSKFNIGEPIQLEERVVYIGMDEALKLLKESMQSETVLTNVFLGTNKRKA